MRGSIVELSYINRQSVGEEVYHTRHLLLWWSEYSRMNEGETCLPSSPLRAFFFFSAQLVLLVRLAILVSSVLQHVARDDSVSGMAFALIVAAVCWREGWYT